MLGGSIKAARSALVAGVAFAVPLLFVVACTESALRYSSVHVGGRGENDGGVQLYAVGDELGIVPAVAPAGFGRSETTDSVFELRSCATQDGSFATLYERHDTELTRITSLRVDGVPRAAIAAAIKEKLRDAGHPIGFDVTFAFVDDDGTTEDAGSRFKQAVVRFYEPETGPVIEKAVEMWRAVLADDEIRQPSNRRDNERAMAAALDIALAYELAGEHDEALVFGAIAVLHAPTHALELDVQHLLRATALVAERPPWTLPLPKRDGCAPLKEEPKSLPERPTRLELARYVFHWRELRPGLGAEALLVAAGRATATDSKDPIRASAETLNAGARALQVRNRCTADGGTLAALPTRSTPIAKAPVVTDGGQDGGECQ